MTSPTYAPNGQATVVVVVTSNGQPFADAKFAASFGFPGALRSCSAATDSTGTGSCYVVVPEEPDGTHVPVVVQVVGPHGEHATTSTSFIVQRA